MMTRKERKAERWRIYRQLFRLIDSYDPSNIALAISIMKNDKGMQAAAQNRYYPIMRALDSGMGRSWGELANVLDFMESGFLYGWKLPDFLTKFMLHYKALGELDAVHHIINKGAATAFGRINNVMDLERLAEFELPVPVKQINIQTQGRLGKSLSGLHLQELETLHLKNCLEIFEDIAAVDSLPQLSVVDISFCGLREFPLKLIKQPKLSYLRLHACKIEEVPDCFEADMPLRGLFLDGSPLYSLPASIAKLQHLERLSLHMTGIKALPAACRELPNLRHVTISNRQIQRRDAAGLAEFKANLPPNCEVVIF